MMNTHPQTNAIRLTKHRGVATKLDQILAQIQNLRGDVAKVLAAETTTKQSDTPNDSRFRLSRIPPDLHDAQ